MASQSPKSDAMTQPTDGLNGKKRNEPRDIGNAWYYVNRCGVDVCTGDDIIPIKLKTLQAMIADIRRSFPKRRKR